MKIGRQDQPITSICRSDAEHIEVRGLDLCDELIGQIGFADYFFLLVTGGKPTSEQSYFLNAVLVAIAEHGLVPSVQAARMTYAAAPDALQGAVAAGILGCGTVVLGSAEVSAQFLQRIVASAEADGRPVPEAARAELVELRAGKRAVPGWGHPEHVDGDPRAKCLIRLARQRGVAGRHVALVDTVTELVPDIYGRRLLPNVSAAIPAVMLDVGFPAAVMKGVPILARTAGLIGHLYEESQRPIGFTLAYNAEQAIGFEPQAQG
ncbi:MAG TPA: citryl-CoA lyase [Stellaceae bacterium]|nr:citryl-CoA lyase [Stellaceae bacterium]